MNKFQGQKLGLREKETNKLISVYPYEVEGTDSEINKSVRDWFYKQDCGNDDILLNSYVDVLTDDEVKSRGL